MRVSNELGAAHPRTARLSVVVALISSSLTGLLLSLVLMVTWNQYPSLFSADNEVRSLVKQLTPLLALSILVNSIQPTLSGNNLFSNKHAINFSDFVTILFTIYSWHNMYVHVYFLGKHSGVAIGIGWQGAVAYVNIACYYLLGIPLGLVMGYKFNMGVTVSYQKTSLAFSNTIVLLES